MSVHQTLTCLEWRASERSHQLRQWQNILHLARLAVTLVAAGAARTIHHGQMHLSHFRRDATAFGFRPRMVAHDDATDWQYPDHGTRRCDAGCGD